MFHRVCPESYSQGGFNGDPSSERTLILLSSSNYFNISAFPSKNYWVTQKLWSMLYNMRFDINKHITVSGMSKLFAPHFTRKSKFYMQRSVSYGSNNRKGNKKIPYLKVTKGEFINFWMKCVGVIKQNDDILF